MIKKIITLIIGAILMTPIISFAKTIEVCPSCNVKSIKQAVDLAENGDVILIKKGIYKETDILISKSITLKGEPGAIIDGNFKGEIIKVEADNFTIDGLEIINGGKATLQDLAAVRITNSKNFVVQNLTIRKPFFGIYLQKSNFGIVRNNKILNDATSEFGAGNGIHLWYSHNNTIENNQSIQNRDGIYLEFSSKNVISNNLSQKNARYGLHFMFCDNNDVNHNTFKANGAGIAIMFSKEMQASHNIFEDNWGSAAYALLLKEVFDTKLTHNVFRRNTTGINVESSNRITYTNNDFISNGWAVNSKGGNYENIFKENNFLNNSFDVSYTGHMNKNLFEGNYWSDYKGYDLDKNGVGDIPFRPVKLFSYLAQKAPEAIILLRSMFIDIVDFAEKVSPVFTPDKLLDEKPKMKIILHDKN